MEWYHICITTYLPRSYTPTDGEMLSLTPSTFNVVPRDTKNYPLSENDMQVVMHHIEWKVKNKKVIIKKWDLQTDDYQNLKDNKELVKKWEVEIEKRILKNIGEDRYDTIT